MSTPDAKETLDAHQPDSPPEKEAAERLYLLVFEGDSSSLCPLPREGEILIGRGSTADLRVQDASVSRHHARVSVTDGVARIADLDSHNGVKVNGVRVEGAQPLRNGDVVELGDVTLVLNCEARPRATPPLLDANALQSRLADELERVVRYERSVGVVALELGPFTASLAELVRAASGGGLRRMDVVGQQGPGQLVILLPELTRDEVEDSARHLVEALLPLVPGARAGLATAPRDGMDADALLSAARAAALAAPTGGVGVSGPNLYRLELGERSVIVADAAMVRIYEQLRRLASSSIAVLIHGETGSGKENAAWAVHHWSKRASGPFLAVNCATLVEALAESTLFGHERGAFSGAATSQAGLFEQASGGTLFLDEVAELSLPVQAKLLRALDQKRITRLGDTRERPVDVRIVAATHQSLADAVKAGRFREDLFFRLSTAVVLLRPLRSRPREVPLLARAFLEEACAREGRPPLDISAAAMELLCAYHWEGNVRVLKGVMERAAAMADGPVLEPSHLPDALQRQEPDDAEPPSPPKAPEAPRTFRPIAEELREVERQRMLEALEATGGVQKHAARLIGMPLRTFALKYKQYGLSRWTRPET
ncbi:sigma 54-interacting transcriptional regulator [Pyxidicoccus sp. MSG2]|uniref:sigma 54-interacting transcriptional regulator n=1 Tax=Pyxidicoccus sp. MSG2 TaxID=2996790 RepID=UPI00226F317B|nr:sigma 54-interacting transcriptional regulator [Pyxidicoccus sp. MSG2]MCY1017151.1 sigma 54-interacting transcriptional regulator [Pyxidicoccus sp. MSG2]